MQRSIFQFLKKSTTGMLAFFLFLGFSPSVFAQTNPSSGVSFDAPAGFSTSLGGFIGGGLSLAMLVGAILLFLYLIWGGIEWITSGGDKGKIENARNKITQAVIGMIVLASVVALFMLVQRFLGINVLQFTGSSESGTGGSSSSGGTSEGNCVVGSGLQNDGGAGGYCQTGGAMVECHDSDSHLSYPHYDPCYCIEGIDQQVPGYDFSSC